jgi:predicted alpha/beta-hydrolase family hydrolase
MLFLQGTRDEFAQLDLLQGVVKRLGDRATLHLVTDGDHSFKVPKRTGKTEADVMNELAETFQQWAARVLSPVATPRGEHA